MAMPGALSLIPSIGTALVIYAGNAAGVGLLLSNPIAVFIGRVSYSLYLVHWPMAVFFERVFPGKQSAVAIAAMLALTVLASLALYFMVEAPFREAARSQRTFWRSRRAAAYASVIILLCSGCAFAWATEGLKFRLPPLLRSIPTSVEMWHERNPTVRVGSCFMVDKFDRSAFLGAGCLRIDPAKKNFLIMGDSLASDAYSYLSQAFPSVNFLQATLGNCHPTIAYKRTEDCSRLLSFIFDEFLRTAKLDGVVLVASWAPSDLEGIDRTLLELNSRGTNSILFGPPVRFDKDVTVLIYESGGRTKKVVTKYVFSHRHAFDVVNAKMHDRFQARTHFVDAQATECAEKCRLFDNDGNLLFLDFAHLTKSGARYMAPLFARRYGSLFGER
jgi:hypothetical protein